MKKNIVCIVTIIIIILIIIYIVCRSKYLDIDDTTSFTNEKIELLIETIINKIKERDETFNIENYVYHISKNSDDNEDYVIDFIYKIGDFETNSGYVAMIKNGKLDQLIDRRIENFEDQIITDFEEYEVTEEKKEYYKNIAINEASANLENDTSIVKTEEKLYYDMSTNKKYIIILITYKYEDSISVDEKYYEI